MSKRPNILYIATSQKTPDTKDHNFDIGTYTIGDNTGLQKRNLTNINTDGQPIEGISYSDKKFSILKIIIITIILVLGISFLSLLSLFFISLFCKVDLTRIDGFNKILLEIIKYFGSALIGLIVGKKLD